MTGQGVPATEGCQPACEDCPACSSPDRRIGVLLVHGMGEQDPGAHAEKVVRRLVKSWEKLCDIRQTWVNPSSASEAPGNAVPSKSPDSARIIVRVVVAGEVAEKIDVHFHEAWWADLGGIAESCGSAS